jgi:endonuclease/exonuclease/phosphatase family metal-dependent hydrolase
MDEPTTAERARWRGRLGDEDLHRRLLAGLPCLHEVGRCEPTEPVELSGWVRVVAWNIQRGRRPREVAARLASCEADVTLLSEVDSGMARTQNVNVTDAVATQLRAGYAFGAEFVELGLGDPSEQSEAAGRDNERGLHGNAIVSRAELDDPILIRLPDVGLGWFAADSPQPRVGGRMAVVATVTIDGVGVQLASAHFENRTGAGHRAEQMEALLATLDARSGGGPAIVGGDLNTLGGSYEELFDRSQVRTLRREDPTRFTWPVPYEPLFDVARAHGFEWTEANVAAPTTEHDAIGRPNHVPIKLDWLLVRGLVARRPAVVAAGGLSDHNLVSVGVRRR